jgi:hypothetical protein
MPTWPSASPGSNHTCHSGRDRSSRSRRNCSAAQQRRLITAVREREDPHVIGEVEGRGVHPQRPAQPRPGHVQPLPEPGHQVQPGCDQLPDRLDPQAAARAGQVAAVQDGQRADVLWPDLIGPQHALIFVGQPGTGMS